MQNIKIADYLSCCIFSVAIALGEHSGAIAKSNPYLKKEDIDATEHSGTRMMSTQDVVMEEEVGPCEFAPGGIHEKDTWPVWEQILQATPWVLRTIQKGYSIPFWELPGPYMEKNNASALQDMHTVRGIVAEMIA